MERSTHLTVHADLARRWHEVLPPSVARTTAAHGAFDEVVAAYSGAGRHYHSLEHIEALLRLVEQQRSKFADPISVELAVFYHDIVYDPARRDNELQSARICEARLAGLGLPPALVVRVGRLIEATAHGVAAPDVTDADLMRFLDFDLSILAAPRSRYAAYAAAIRAEYAAYPDAVYRAGRARVLQSFLDQERLFHSADLHTLWDAAARDNLRWEIAELTAPS